MPTLPNQSTLLSWTNNKGVIWEMLQVVEINYIRHETNQKGRSYKSVAESVNHDWRTVKKYANQEEFPQKLKQKRKSPVMDRVKPIIDQWLEEDLKFKKKFQRTAKRMYTQLVEEQLFEGSERSVRRYVSVRKAELKKEAEGAALPLETKPGTAQVDFGKAPFNYAGNIIKLPFLVMSFPFSNTFYYQVFPSENTECFLEGLQRIFLRLGNVPRVIRFDNLSPAVAKVHKNGVRDLTESFERFVLHYGFEAEFCNPASGNEKGHVENMVKYIRNNFLLPAAYFTDLDEFNEQQWNVAEKDRLRTHYEKGIEQHILHEQTVEQHLVLPAKPFHCGRIHTVKADKSGLVHFETKLYSTSPRFAQKKVFIEVFYNEVLILDENYQCIVRHPRLYGNQTKSMIWQPYLKLLAHRPRAIKYSGVYEQLPEEWQRYLASCNEAEQKATFSLLAELMGTSSFEELTEALRIASTVGHPSAEQIKQAYRAKRFNAQPYEPIQIESAIPPLPEVSRGTERYDIFFEPRCPYE